MSKLNEYIKDGYWELTAAPLERKQRFELSELRPTLEKAQVRHRGWPFPFRRPEDEGMFSTYYQNITIGKVVPRYEGCRLYEDSLFFWKSSQWENHEPGYGKQSLSYGNVNWQITEMLLFLKRLYEKILKPNEIIQMRLRITGCKGRQLVNDHGSPIMFTKCSENDIVIEDNFNCSTLKASWKDFARKYSVKIYTIFGLSDIDENSLIESQNKLLKMKMI